MKSIPRCSTSCLLVGILFLSLFLNTYHIWWGLPLQQPITWSDQETHQTRSPRGHDDNAPAPTAWSTDEIAPLGPLVYAKRTFLQGGWTHKYPAFHFMILSAAYTPYVAYLVLSGQFSVSQASDAWPYGLSDPVWSLSIFTLIARFVSALMGTGIVIFIYLITRQLFAATAGLFAAFIVAFSFPFIYYSHTSNVDIPYLFWATAGVFFYTKLLHENHTRDYILLGVSMALAVATKDQAYGLLPLLPFSLAWIKFQDLLPSQGGKAGWAALPWRQFFLAGLGFLGAYLIAANVVNNWQGYLKHVVHVTGPVSAPYQEFQPTVAGHLGLLRKTLTLLSWSLNPPLFALCLTGLCVGLFRFRKVALALLTPLVSYYLFFVAVVLYVYPRFVLPLMLGLAIFGGKLLQDLWTAPRPYLRITQPLIFLLFIYSFLYGASANWLLQQDARYQAEEWLAQNVPPDSTIETYGPTQYLPRFPKGASVHLVFLQGYVEEQFHGRRPEYVLLVRPHYRRILEDSVDDFDQEEFIQHLMDGTLGYQLVTSFKASDFVAPNLIPGLNPQILIFTRLPLKTLVKG